MSLHKLTVLSLIAALVISGLFFPVGAEGEPIRTLGPGDFEHFVIAEEITATWCQYCPTAAEQLGDIYYNDGYEFYFVALITDVNDKANDRKNDYPTFQGYPTVYFDGGYRERVGAQSDKSSYQEDIEDSGARSDTPVSLEMNMSYLGDSAIYVKTRARWDEDGNIVNPDLQVHLRVYITEIESRYDNYDGNPYHFGFLDYAFDQGLDLQPHEWWVGETVWVGSEHEDANGDDFGDIDYENIALIAAVFNDESSDSDEYNLMCAGTIAPELVITAPEDGSTMNDDFTLEVESEGSLESGDPTGIAKLEYAIDGGNWKNVPKKSGKTYSVEVDSSDLENGEHELVVRSTDDKETTNEKMITFEYSSEDTEAPEVRNMQPIEGRELSGTVKVSADVTDESGFTVHYKVDSGSWQGMAKESGDHYTADWDSTSVLDGQHTVTIRAEDEHSNSVEEEVQVTVENLKLHITTPENESSVENMVEVVGDVFHTVELDSAEYRVDTGVWQEMSIDGDRCTADWNSRDVANGRYTLMVRVRDTIGNSEERSVDVDVENAEEDTSPPSLDIEEPKDDDTLSEVVTVKAQASDENGINKVEFKAGSGSWKELEHNSGDLYTFDWNTRELDNGDYTLYFRAEDSSGNEKTKELGITIANQEDTTSPQIEAIYPVSETVVSLADGHLLILAHAQDDQELDKVECSLESGERRLMEYDEDLSDAYGKATYSFEYGQAHQEFRNLEDGTHTLVLKAGDGAGNEETLTFDFDTDSTAPEISVHLPSCVGDTLEVSYTLSDDHPIDSLECGIEGSVLKARETPSSEGSLTLDIGSFDDGSYNFWMDATDVAGNTGQYEAAFTIDNTVPLLELLTPSGSSPKIDGEMVLEIDMIDDNPASVDWSLHTLSGPADLSGGIFVATVDTTQLPDGRHTLIIDGYDLAGNEVSLEIDVFVDNTAPQFLSVEANLELAQVLEDIYVKVEIEDVSGIGSVKLWYELCQDDTCLMAEEVEMTENRGIYEATMNFDIPGTVNYRVVAKDALGNKGESELFELEVVGEEEPDAELEIPSSVLLTSLAQQGEVSGQFLLGGGAYSSNNVKMKIDDGEWISVETTTNTFDRKMEEFTLTDLEGQDFSLSDYEGKVVILDFMATWCKGCKTLSENLKPIKENYGSSVVIISIDVDTDESPEKLENYRDSHGTDWRYAFDTANLAESYGIEALPHVVFITPEGYISGEFIGALEVKEIEAQIGLALSEKVWSFTFDTTTLSNGQHTITVMTEDGEESETQSFMVNNPKAKDNDDEIEGIYLVGVGSLIFLAVALGSIMLYQKQKEDEEYVCPDCDSDLRYIEKYDAWYCDVCKEYV